MQSEEKTTENHLIQLTEFLSVHTLWLNAIITCCEPKVYAHSGYGAVFTYSYRCVVYTFALDKFTETEQASSNNPQRVLYVIAFCHISSSFSSFFFLSLLFFFSLLLCPAFSFAISISIHFPVQLCNCPKVDSWHRYMDCVCVQMYWFILPNLMLNDAQTTIQDSQ